MTALKGLRVIDISCGYGHVCYLVEEKASDGTPAEVAAVVSSAPAAVPKSKAASANKKGAAAASSSKEGGSLGPVLSAFPVLQVEDASKKRGNDGKSKAAAPSKKGKK